MIFVCSYRGKIAAKHKGEVEMYFLTAAENRDEMYFAPYVNTLPTR
jgi:hypothetical protein